MLLVSKMISYVVVIFANISTNLLILAAGASSVRPSTLPTIYSPLTASSTFSCQLNSHMTLSWSMLDANTVRVNASIDSTLNYLSFGVVQSYLSMVPSGHTHSIYLYAQNDASYIGRFYMTSYSSDFSADTRARVYSKLQSATVQGSRSFLTVDYVNNKQEYSDDAVIDSSSSNTVIWAHGGVWPEKHPSGSYGFVTVDWSAGTCVTSTSATTISASSPYFVFLPPLLIPLLVRTPLRRLTYFKYLLHKRLPSAAVLQEYSVAGLLFLLLHLIVCIVVFVSSAQEDANSPSAYITASGNVAIMNFWLAMFPSSKSIVMHWLTAVPFERTIKYHTVIASSAVLMSFAHAIFNIQYHADIYFSAVAVGSQVVPLYGALAFFFFLFMAGLAQEPIRRGNYELFLYVHYLYPLGILFLALHASSTIPGFIPGLLCHVIDMCMRIYSWWVQAPCTTLCSVGNNIVMVKLPNKSKGYCGEYFFLQIPTVSHLEWHPFSVAFTTQEYMYFYIQSQGDSSSWTSKLNRLAITAPPSIKISADGPYGRLSVRLKHYSSVYMIAGGIGITPLLRILQILYTDKKYSNIKNIIIYWSIRGLHLYDAILKEHINYIVQNSHNDNNNNQDNQYNQSVDVTVTNPLNNTTMSPSTSSGIDDYGDTTDDRLLYTHGHHASGGVNSSSNSSNKERNNSLYIWNTSITSAAYKKQSKSRVLTGSSNNDVETQYQQQGPEDDDEEDEERAGEGGGGTRVETVEGLQIKVRNGRMTLPGLITAAAASGSTNTSVGARRAGDCVILTCGPASMTREVLLLANAKGIDCHVESFNY